MKTLTIITTIFAKVDTISASRDKLIQIHDEKVNDCELVNQVIHPAQMNITIVNAIKGWQDTLLLTLTTTVTYDQN